MAKEKVSISIDVAVLSAADADARAAGINRSQLIERALRNEHLRNSLDDYKKRIVPALKIDEYADEVYRANRSAGL